MIASLTGLLLWGTTGATLAAAGWKKNRLLIAAGVLLILASPWLLGLLSMPSLATLGLACGVLFKQKLRPALAGWLLLSGLALYSSALGFWAFDVYVLGYAPQVLLIWCAISLALAWQQGHKALAIAWLLALALFPLGVLESANLWDALLDPMAMITGAVALLLSLKSKAD
ncbi:hypothetical protein [Iodobacter fluviatilis]|uniref:Uncharacterized protein n=1 Tax=Iodobacter fluviatilis TaxID=537 RepID=A0A377Q4F1_9NEIS|nr:hypothetical protein [Iodobacter fluviatilis]TCU84084.1 hypothetical protein EV682_11017 [Iodobacter fluviatilis]STQ89697.1 Uncharacterised protein [Iodobacter fluviatilis]